MMKVIAVISLLVATVTCIEIAGGKCPNLTTVANFQASNYVGLWHEYARYSLVFERGSCITATYSLNSNGSITVVNAAKEKNGDNFTMDGIATFTEGTSVAKLSIKFDVSSIPSPYWVLDTDYTGYAVVYTCFDLLNLVHSQSVWILTRDRIPSQDVVDKAIALVKAHNLSTKDLIITVQTNCD